MSSKARREQKRKHFERKKQQRSLEKRRQSKRQYNPHKHLTRNQKEVASRLIDGEVTMLSHAGWGFTEQFLVFMNELGIFELFNIDGAKFYRQMFDIALLLVTYEMKVLLGIASMNQVGERLFKDLALMRLIGYTSDQLASGFCKRGHKSSQKPLHKNTLADAVEKLTAEELELIFNTAVERLWERGFFANSKGVFALDGSDLPTTKRYQGAGKRTIKKKKTKHGKLIEVEETVYGFKLIALYEVTLRQVVAVKVSKINPHDSNFTLELVEQARRNLGPQALKLLLVDRGFLDGETLWTLKHKLHIDFVVPAKSTMHITRDAQSLAKEAPDGDYVFLAQRDEKQQGEVMVRGLRGLITYDQYGDAEHQKRVNRKDFEPNPINALLIQSYHGKVAEPGKEKVFLTSLPVNDPLLILDYYDLRSLIENCLFRELKQGWNLLAFPKKTEDAVRGHVYLTILTFNLVNAYRTELGQDLAEEGIRRRRLVWQDANKVLVIAGQFYAIFDLEELLILMGCEPASCWRVDPDRVRREYGLDVLAQAA
jgi:hypothetical protein